METVARLEAWEIGWGLGSQTAGSVARLKAL